MHGYHWNTTELTKILEVFVGGQCQINTRHAGVYRGKIVEMNVFQQQRKIKPKFEWLCVRRPILDAREMIQQRWFLITNPPSGNHFLDFDYFIYYVQEDEERIKLKGWGGEACRFYLPDDYTNLVPSNDNEYVSRHATRKDQSRLVLAMTFLKIKVERKQ